MTQIALNERGQGVVEYALIFALVILVVIVVVYLMGPAVGNMYSNIVTELQQIG
jgi:pilus assembly protein Flp/PilA